MEVGCADPYELFSSVYDSFKADDNYSELYSILKGIRAQCSFPLTCPLAWDVGTGTGLFAELLAKDGYVTTATDICPTMIEQAKMRCSSVRYFVADAREEHPAESYFDLVTAIDDVFNCIDSLSGLRATFKNIHLALKGGGLFQFDLVCKKAFLEYMGSVQFRGNESVKFLSYPSSPARDEEHQFSMGVFTLRRSASKNSWYPTLVEFKEYYYEPQTVYRELQHVGFEFVRVDALGDEGLIENYSPCLGESANKILFLCRKGGAL